MRGLVLVLVLRVGLHKSVRVRFAVVSVAVRPKLCKGQARVLSSTE